MFREPEKRAGLGIWVNTALNTSAKSNGKEKGPALYSDNLPLDFAQYAQGTCRYACNNQCCICGDANLGIAKLSGDREFLDGLARLILH